ncbi:MAG: glycoside hydrolase 15-related protein, partial [Humibacillus sp.]|nr:glycoside hydrolase 15-related protein [Humibacillus sp.]
MSRDEQPTPIEEYAVLGDLGTAALVSRRGSVDWLCLPRFDSSACFAALLGTPDHGRWLLGPVDEDAVSTRSYVDGSFVLETVHRTATGAVRVTDLMPIADGRADVLRRVEGLEGTVEMVHEWVVRFGYGRTRPWVTRHVDDREGRSEHVIRAIAGPDMLVLRGERLPRARHGRHVDRFHVSAGESMTFSTTWFPSHEALPPPLEVRSRIQHTLRLSQRWTAESNYDGPYAAPVSRSLLVLRLLSHGVTG